jgi:hypothetical protein
MESDLLALSVGALCERLDVPYRHVRYVLEQGILPQGVEPKPDRGHHRLLSAGQAFWLGIVLKLKQSGVTAGLAGRIAEQVRLQHRGLAQNLGYDFGFAPFLGQLKTEQRWLAEVGDLTYLRTVTDAYPSHPGLFEFPWVHIKNKRHVNDIEPIVILRVDLGRLAHLLLAGLDTSATRS